MIREWDLVGARRESVNNSGVFIDKRLNSVGSLLKDVVTFNLWPQPGRYSLVRFLANAPPT